MAARPAEPVPVWEAGNALTLTDKMRSRLRSAVRALLGLPGLVGAPDPVRMTAVVLAARTSAADLTVEMTARELGRWVGVTASTIGHQVRPHLNRENIADSDNRLRPGTRVVTGISWSLLPLRDARHHQPADHPLRLQRVDFAVLWGLLEAVCAPGWSHRDGTQTPPGLLGRRTGRDAATDRLALVLLVLEARQTGVVRLCGGAVDQHGRMAATVARLLGCSSAAGAQVLARLVAAGVVEARQMPSGGEQLVILAVQAAHREMRRLQRTEGRPGGLISRPRRGARSAGRDQMPQDSQKPQFKGGNSPSGEGGSSAGLHADHAPVPALGDEGAGDSCFSGEGRRGSGDLPGRACAREDQAADPGGTAAPVPSAGTEGGPLCGEMPQKSAAVPIEPERQEQAANGDAGQGQDAAARLLADMVGRHRGGLRGRVPRPRRELQAVLAPVEVLWDRLERRGARRRVEQAARCELGRVKRWLSADRAEAYLARRLTRRLTAQPGRAAGVNDPVGWLLERGLPQRSDCTDERCDEGVLVHSGAACERCEDHVLDLRGRRRRIADQVQAGMPDAAPQQQHDAFEDQLRKVVNADAERDEERRREREAARATAEAEAVKARDRRMAQAAARRTLPCEECDEPMAGGLCPVCRDFRAVDKLIEEAVTAIAAGCGEPDAPDLTAALAKSAEAEARTRIQDSCVQFEAAGATDVLIAVQARLTAQGIAHEYTTTALRMLANDLEATAEADRAHAAEMRRRHLHPDAEAAQEAADEAALKARQRTAKHLLDTRSKAWRTTQTPAPAKATVLRGQAAAYATGASQARAAVADATPTACPQWAWNCTDCGRHFIGGSPDSSLCAPCDGKAAGLSRAERFARLAGTAS